ncbi:MAG TPA: hypothetical protein VLF41_03305 [Candidatus Nanoarchaeia archaeon]|nr:hypothetical protein [Candidatus Nanoarchaeia archaeon]
MIPNTSNLNFTPDIIILVILFGLVFYGLLLGRNKIKTLAMSTYVGIVIATELGGRLADLLASKHISGLSNNIVLIILFVAPLLILEFGRREHHGRGSKHGGMIMTLVLAVLTAALIISSGLHLLDPETRKTILQQSALATAVSGLRGWWIALVPLAVVGENFIPNRD